MAGARLREEALSITEEVGEEQVGRADHGAPGGRTLKVSSLAPSSPAEGSHGKVNER